jgi:hypothetical protein
MCDRAGPYRARSMLTPLKMKALHELNYAPLARAPVAGLVIRSALRSRVNSHENRRRAKDLVWRWVGSKWPRLIPSSAELEKPALELSFAGQRLALSSSLDASTWILEVAYSEKHHGRTWTTRAMVTDSAGADWLSLETACSDLDATPTDIAPPKVLGAWVERLDLEDAGVAVLGKPRLVSDTNDLAAFCDHVLLEERTLPIIALTHKPDSRYYGVDPDGAAEAVRGLAHVVCLPPALAASATPRLGKDLVPVPGIPRIYATGFRPDAHPKDHPLLRQHLQPEAARADPGALRRMLCRRVCAMSVAKVFPS